MVAFRSNVLSSSDTMTSTMFSPWTLVISTISIPSVLSVPPNTLDPAFLETGTDSPARSFSIFVERTDKEDTYQIAWTRSHEKLLAQLRHHLESSRLEALSLDPCVAATRVRLIALYDQTIEKPK